MISNPTSTGLYQAFVTLRSMIRWVNLAFHHKQTNKQTNKQILFHVGFCNKVHKVAYVENISRNGYYHRPYTIHSNKLK